MWPSHHIVSNNLSRFQLLSKFQFLGYAAVSESVWMTEWVRSFQRVSAWVRPCEWVSELWVVEWGLLSEWVHAWRLVNDWVSEALWMSEWVWLFEWVIAWVRPCALKCSSLTALLPSLHSVYEHPIMCVHAVLTHLVPSQRYSKHSYQQSDKDTQFIWT